MKRRKFPGLVDLFEVNDPIEIKAFARNPRLDRRFETRTCPINRPLLQRSLQVLSFRGRRFPTMRPRDDAERAHEQQELWNALSEKAAPIRNGPDELESLASWVRGVGHEGQLGMLVQQLLGELFSSQFLATEESWAAAEILVAAPRSRNYPQMAWWFLTGRIKRSKVLLADMVNGDLSAVNAIGIAVHNVVKSLQHMRLLYADARLGLSAEAAAKQSLFAPVSVYRQATAAGEFDGCPFSRHSLFVLAIGEASQLTQDRSLVFMEESWSRCPANIWVPAMLEGVWRRACMSTDAISGKAQGLGSFPPSKIGP